MAEVETLHPPLYVVPAGKHVVVTAFFEHADSPVPVPVQDSPVVQALPSLQIAPAGAGPAVTQTGTPLVHEILPKVQTLPAGVQAVFGVHAPHAPVALQ